MALLQIALVGASFLVPQESQVQLLSDGAAERPLIFRSSGDDIWVRGADYKASATADGFSFFPFLGSAAPQNFPVRFELTRMAVGRDDVEFGPATRVSRDGDRFVFERGQVSENYDLALGSVEQCFTFDPGIAGGQDVVLSIGFGTDLVPRTAADGSVVFEGDLGGVTYGTAVAFDQTGERVDVPIELAEDELRLKVPASFLRRARGEVVVDPIIATYFVGPLPVPAQKHCDVAYDLTTDTYTFAYDEVFSVADSDIFWSTRQPDGTLVGSGAMNLSGAHFVEPKIAGTDFADTVAIVAGDRQQQTSDIRLMRVALQTNTGGAMQFIATVDTAFPSYDIGGRPGNFSAARFRVVWVDNDPVFGSRIGRRVLGSVGFISSGQYFDTSLTERKSRVCISKTLGMGLAADDLSSNIAYVAYDQVANETELRVLLIDRNGAVTQGPSAIRTTNGPSSYVHVDVSDPIEHPGFQPAYLVLHQEESLTGDALVASFCHGDQRVASPKITIQEHASPDVPRQFPQLAATPTKFVIVYHEYNGFELYPFLSTMSVVGAAGVAIAERRVPLGQAGPDSAFQAGPQIVTAASGGAFASEQVAVCWSDTSVNAIDGRMLAVTYDMDTERALALQYCEGTTNSTGERSFLTLLGDPGPNGNKRAVATGLPQSQFGYMNSATSFGLVPGAGGSAGTLCIGGVIGRYNDQVILSDSTGTIETIIDPQQIPSGPVYASAMSGSLWFFQLWHRDVVFGSQTSNFTNAVAWFVD